MLGVFKKFLFFWKCKNLVGESSKRQMMQDWPWVAALLRLAKMHGDIWYYSFKSLSLSLIRGPWKSILSTSWHFPVPGFSGQQRAVGNTSVSRFACGHRAPKASSLHARCPFPFPWSGCLTTLCNWGCRNCGKWWATLQMGCTYLVLWLLWAMVVVAFSEDSPGLWAPETRVQIPT